MLKVYLKQNINILLKIMKIMAEKSWKIQRLLLNIQIICKILKSATQLIVFDDIIADVISNKKLSPILTELFIRREKLNISTIFTTQTYFKIPKDVRLNSRHFFIRKVKSNQEFQQIACSNSLDFDFKDFMNHYKKYTTKPYSSLVIDTTLASDVSKRIFYKKYKN